MCSFWLIQLCAFFLEPLILVVSNALLDPYEKDLQEGFANEARKILSSVHPFVIGITGSYGKTSSKVILTDILNSVSPTFTTPRSINSYMGVTREIRERMKPHHKYAVIEMGAYYTGSIKRMCSLTPPNAAIVTAVGAMHLERFGSQENVFKAKSELPEALPKDGILVINGDYDYCRKMGENHKDKRVFVYGLDEEKGPVDALMYDIEPTEKGTNFAIRWQGKVYTGSTGHQFCHSLAGKSLHRLNIAARTTDAIECARYIHNGLRAWFESRARSGCHQEREDRIEPTGAATCGDCVAPSRAKW
jgi:UDP-N-acetylmuramoyl-tripeptide--D-alanyl-D-alanine ligase